MFLVIVPPVSPCVNSPRAGCIFYQCLSFYRAHRSANKIQTLTHRSGVGAETVFLTGSQVMSMPHPEPHWIAKCHTSI